MARRDADGFIYIVDRSKDMIITGGFNVFPREVEDVLTQHPAVAAAAVIGVPDAKWGEAVKAVVVLKPGASVAPEELIALVREHKGPVQAPKSVEFIECAAGDGLRQTRQEGAAGALLDRARTRRALGPQGAARRPTWRYQAASSRATMSFASSIRRGLLRTHMFSNAPAAIRSNCARSTLGRAAGSACQGRR